MSAKESTINCKCDPEHKLEKNSEEFKNCECSVSFPGQREGQRLGKIKKVKITR